MMAVECLRKSGPYRRHVSDGVLTKAPLTGKNSSVGLRSTWYIAFTDDQASRIVTAPTMMRMVSGAARNARRALRAPR
jgi:hypothetical protein